MDVFRKGAPSGSVDARQNLYGRIYEKHIQAHLEQGHSDESARHASVGGDFEAFGKIERDALLSLGLMSDHFVVDIGCGAGRLTRALCDILSERGRYAGFDVNRKFLEEAESYPRSKGFGNNFTFGLLTGTAVPIQDNLADFAVMFSVATHIDFEDTYSYLCEIHRFLKPGGMGLISYLSMEIEDHWRIFLGEAAIAYDERAQRVRNHVMAPGALRHLALKTGLEIQADYAADEPWIVLTEEVDVFGERRAVGDKIHLGQACLVVRKADSRE